MRTSRLLLLIGAVMTFGVGCQQKPGAPTSKTRTPKSRPGMPLEIKPQAVPFEIQAVKKKFLNADQQVRQIADANWSTQPGEQYQYLFSNGGTFGYCQNYAGIWKRSVERADAEMAQHQIVISTDLYDKPRQAYSFEVRADWLPASGWRSRLHFYSADGLNGFRESFTVKFVHPQFQPEDEHRAQRSLLIFGPGQVRCRVSTHDPDYYYSLEVTSQQVIDGRLQVISCPEAARQYWASPESFRAAVQVELDLALANFEQRLAAEKWIQVTTHGGPTGADVPMPASVSPIPPTIIDSLRAQAQKSIETRRELVNVHAEGMYAAMIATFPNLPDVFIVQPGE